MVMAKRTATKLPASSARGPKAARQRRLQAARLFQQGHSQAEVARRLQVSRQTASRWHARWLAGGRRGSRVRHRPVDAAAGRRGDLAAEGGQLPPGARVVAAAPPPVEPAAARPPCQRARRGRDRPLARGGVAPDQKGAAKQGAWICFVDESGAALTPPVRRTWAPRGHTPILRHRMRGRKRVSLAGVCCYRPDGSDARLAFHLREGAYDTDQLLGVVGGLQRLLAGDRGVGQPERGGAGQPCLRFVGGVGRGGRAGCGAGTGRTRTAVLVPASGRAFPMSVTSFYETL